ncbi:MAG: DUF1778 domain-containing protein [Sutterellaceae bacterium]|nr:DUF1778 domain-containing protein [Sutterellaceae bacterium]
MSMMQGYTCIEISLSPVADEMIRQAARLREISVAAYIAESAQKLAQEDIATARALEGPTNCFVLERDGGEQFANAYDNELEESPTMIKGRRLAESIPDIKPKPEDLF